MFKNILRSGVIFILTLESRLVLKKYKPKVVAVTGNAGKTSSKDAIAAVLSSDFTVWKNEKSYNSDLGIPLTILNCKNAWSNPLGWFKNIMEGLMLLLLPHKYPEWLVLEVGADKPGDIGKFAAWLAPEVVVVTRIGETPVHIEFFSSRNELIAEKSKLAKALRPGGTLVLNADDPDVLAMRGLAKTARVITYGFSPEADVRASNYSVSYAESGQSLLPAGISWKIDYLGNIIPIKVPGVVGRNNVYSALSAFAVGASRNINLLTVGESIAKYERPVGRLKLIHGLKNSTILDDTYNSSPAALELAIESAHDIKSSGRRIAVLGDMLELGQHTVEAHAKIGRIIPKYFDILITVGQRTLPMAAGALEAGMKRETVVSFTDSVAAGEYLRGLLSEGDLVLVKGSQGVRMERVVERVMSEPSDKARLLPRQEREWLKKV